MDGKTTIEDLKKWVKAFCDERDWDDPHTAKDLAIGVSTEASELLEIFRFIRREEEPQVLATNREAIADELADTLYFLVRFAERFGFDLSESVAKKLEKNALRYPPKNRS